MSFLLTATDALLQGWNGPVVVDGVDLGVLVGPDDRPEDRRVGPWIVAPLDEWSDCAGTEFGMMPISSKTENIGLVMTQEECRDRVARVVAAAVGLDARESVSWSRRSVGSWVMRGASYHGMGAGIPPMDYATRIFQADLSSGEAKMQRVQRGMENLWHLVPGLADVPAKYTRADNGCFLEDAMALLIVAQAVLGE